MGKKIQVHPLAITAIKALHDDAFESEPGMCQKFQRQCVAATYGDRFDRFRAATAHESALRWKASPWAIEPEGWGVVGDIYYWFGDESNPSGHTAIRIPGNKVAENSTAHRHTGNGKGTRPLIKLRGKPDLIVRLPWK